MMKFRARPFHLEFKNSTGTLRFSGDEAFGQTMLIEIDDQEMNLSYDEVHNLVMKLIGELDNATKFPRGV